MIPRSFVRSLPLLALALPLGGSGCAPAAEGEAPLGAELAPVVTGPPSALDPACFPEGSAERAGAEALVLLEPSDGGMACHGVLIGLPGHVLTLRRCRPRPGVTVTATRGRIAVDCTTKLPTAGWSTPVLASISSGGMFDDSPALVSVDPAFGAGLQRPVRLQALVTNEALVLPQYTAVGPAGRPVVDSAFTPAAACHVGLFSGTTFSHTCDTTAVTSGPEFVGGAPLLSTYGLVVGLHRGPSAGANLAYPLAALAPLIDRANGQGVPD